MQVGCPECKICFIINVLSIGHLFFACHIGLICNKKKKFRTLYLVSILKKNTVLCSSRAFSKFGTLPPKPLKLVALTSFILKISVGLKIRRYNLLSYFVKADLNSVDHVYRD